MSRERKVRWAEENGLLKVTVVSSDRVFILPDPEGDVREFLTRYGLKQWVSDRFAALSEAPDIEASIENACEKIRTGALKAERKTSSIRSRIEGKLSSLSDADREMAIAVLTKLGLL